jgi:methyl-accepting chemotaxis protein
VSPEVIVSLVTAAGVILAAVIGAVPAFLSLSRRTAAEGTATRDALDGIANAINTRIDDVRTDIEDVREHVTEVRAWQAGHDAEHLLLGRPQRGDTP